MRKIWSHDCIYIHILKNPSNLNFQRKNFSVNRNYIAFLKSSSGTHIDIIRPLRHLQSKDVWETSLWYHKRFSWRSIERPILLENIVVFQDVSKVISSIQKYQLLKKWQGHTLLSAAQVVAHHRKDAPKYVRGRYNNLGTCASRSRHLTSSFMALR